MVCDKCETKVCHNFCLDPPLDFIPTNEFYCDGCVKEHNLKNKFVRPTPVLGQIKPIFYKEVEMIPPAPEEESDDELKILSKNLKKGSKR